ncbi:TraR/DksA C4-type zinc finger protein [Alphaproteobacteria bacterium]|nr:TraR/DksA C4-type zinc finger protein [Alphaproteobacteria bacterium]
MTDEYKDIDHLVMLIRNEMDQLKKLSETAKDSREPVTLDQQSVGRLSRMDAMQQQSMELATEERRQSRLAALAAALRRVKSGDYGYCLKCDDKIAAGRLAVDPAVKLCIDCA